MASPTRHRFWDGQRLRNVRIGKRMRVVFTCVLALVFFGSTISFWYLREIRKQVEKVSMVEQRMTAVLQIDNSVLKLMNQLYRAAEEHKREPFAAQAETLLETLRIETAWATEVLRNVAPEDGRQRVILDSLNSMLEALPDRVHSLVELAQADDWVALHARLQNQVDHTDVVVAALVRDINENLAESRRALVDQVHQAQRRTIQILIAAGFLSLFAATLLGVLVTRSITRPLDSLKAGTQALSEGRLGVEVAVDGNDELTHLAADFNRTFRELEETYAKVRNSEAHFRSLIENASDFIMILSPTGQILYASPSSLRLLGASTGTLHGQAVRDFAHTDDVPKLDSLLTAEDSAIGNTRSFELRVRRHDGSFRILEGVVTNLALDPNVSGIVVNARDVTERRAAERALREREDQLRQAQKLESIGVLAGGLAHDFNNLLTVINGYSSFLLQGLNRDDAGYDYAQSILDAGERAADLTRQMLAFSRKQILRPAVLNLNEIATESGQLLRRLVGENIELVCELGSSLGSVEADQNQIHQVLMNLCTNARDAMPLGGRLTIETANITLERPSASSDATIPSGRYVRLGVRDTGRGMDEATKQRVFEPFFTTKAQGKGSGLGLASVYGIVRQSGGHIVVESGLDKGTVFQIYFPRVDRAATAAPEPASTGPLTGTETILLVEDEAEVRQIASQSLRNCGYEVIEAADAEAALAEYRANGRTIHLLLTDVVMPGMTGVELSKRLLALDSQLKVIYVSGYADRVLLQHGAMAEATFLQKPYLPAELASKVRTVLAN